eukprot:GHVS01105060.1.p1 GENE.GHVS01105060.1~~GHVS01105060.1.p1  ORF type:complete len:300 (+),score=62.07 GHVS01105060.1:110-1009(+)
MSPRVVHRANRQQRPVAGIPSPSSQSPASSRLPPTSSHSPSPPNTSSITSLLSVLLAFCRHSVSFVYSLGGRPLFGWSLLLLLLAVELQLRRLYTHGCLYMHQLTSTLQQPSLQQPVLSSDCFYLWALTLGGILLAGTALLHHLLCAILTALRPPSLPPADVVTSNLRVLFSQPTSSDAASPPSGSTAASGKTYCVDWWHGEVMTNTIQSVRSCWSPSSCVAARQAAERNNSERKEPTNIIGVGDSFAEAVNESAEKSLQRRRESLLRAEEEEETRVHGQTYAREVTQSFYIGDSDNEG